MRQAARYGDDPFRRAFRSVRRRRGITLAKAAERMEVSKVALSRWERGDVSLGEWRAWRALDWLMEDRADG